MLFKVLMFAILFLAAASLFMALVGVVRNQGSSEKTVKMLSYRVGFSILLLLFLGLSKYMGWLQPHDLKGRPTSQPVISAELATKTESAEKTKTEEEKTTP